MLVGLLGVGFQLEHPRRPPAPCRLRVGVDVGVDRLVERDAGLGQRLLHLTEHVTRQLDVAQDVGHLLGVHAPLLAPAGEEGVPLCGIDPIEGVDGATPSGGRRQRFFRATVAPHSSVPPSVDGAT